MVYQGGKFKQSKEIAPIINNCIKANKIENYYEPFVGGANILDKVICNNLNANDIDSDLIAFYESIKAGELPLKTVSKEFYLNVKDNQDNFPAATRGNIKYMASFGGKPWGGFGGIDKRSGKGHYESSLRNFERQIPVLKKTTFTSKDYAEIDYGKNNFICCDPPYCNTTGYRGIKFDYDRFYEWFINISKDNYVILCEYSAPKGFTCFHQIGAKKTLAASDNKTNVKDCLWYTEGLFKNYWEELNYGRTYEEN